MKLNAAVAVLSCRPNSHPFQERTVTVVEPVKIGRSVARARPASNNVIFDCKVLSRNHALLWYENEQFYLQDTKSSNGTFVNNQRLSKGSEESAPREIFSGDVVQFGVDVMENSRRVTHNCIIATIHLYRPDGSECKPTHPAAMGVAQGQRANLQTQDVYQLAQCIQEALHRERVLETKLSALQHVLQSTQEASETGWQALIDEDRLLSRIELLESQIQTNHKAQTDENLKQELEALQNDKYAYETATRKNIMQVLEEKLEAVKKLDMMERELNVADEELKFQKEQTDKCQEELKELAEKYEDSMKELKEVKELLTEEEKKNVDNSTNAENTKQKLEEKISQMESNESMLTASNEALKAENDQTKEQLISIKARVDNINEQSGELIRIPDVGSRGTQVDMVTLSELNELHKIANADSDNEDEDDDEDMDIEDADDVKKELDALVLNGHDDVMKMEKGQSDSETRDMNSLNKLRCELTEVRKQLETSRAEVQETNQLLETQQRLVGSLSEELALLRPDIAAPRPAAKEGLSEAARLKELLEGTLKKQAELETEVCAARQSADREGRRLQDVITHAQTELEHAQTRAAGLSETVKKLRVQLENEKARSQQLEAEGQRLRADLCSSSSVTSQSDGAGAAKEMGALREECANLRMRILDIEVEMRSSRQENQMLQGDYSALQRSYRQLEELKARLETGPLARGGEPANLTDTQKEADMARQDHAQAQAEIRELRMRVSEREQQVTELSSDLEEMGQDYNTLNFQTGVLFKTSIAPIILLAFAFVMAFYPSLSSITATSSP